MAIPNLDAAARVTRKLLERYGAAQLIQVEELRPGIYRGRLNDGGQALAVVYAGGRIAVKEVEPCW